MATITLTYSLTNGTTADASQVMQNFNDIVNGTSDGTKTFSIAAITVAGTATFNGAVNLGSATDDDISVLGSLATSIPVKTNTSFDIGTATLGLRAVYIGGTSTFTTKILGAATATYTITLPVDVPAGADYVARFSTAGVMTFGHPGPTGASGADSAVSLTLSSARIQVVTPTASRNYTLPTTGVKQGDEFHFVNNAASTTAFVINVLSSGSNQVLTVYPATSNSVVALQDTPTTAAHWMGKHPVQSHWMAWTPTGLWSTNVTWTGFYKRMGDTIDLQAKVVCSGAPGEAGSLYMNLPVTIDTAKLVGGTTVSNANILVDNHVMVSDVGNDGYLALASYRDTTSVNFLYYDDVAAGIGVANNVSKTTPFTFGNTDFISIRVVVPVSGWGPNNG